MQNLPETAVSIYRRRRRRRAVITLSFVSMLLLGTVAYAASYVQGWVGGPSAKSSVVAAACRAAGSTRTLSPRNVTLNVYNTTPREGLAASVANKLRSQGFRVEAIGNDPMGSWILGVAQIRHGRAGTGGALLAIRWLPGAEIMQDARTDASVDVVLGKKYRSVSAPPKTDRSITVKETPRC